MRTAKAVPDKPADRRRPAPAKILRIIAAVTGVLLLLGLGLLFALGAIIGGSISKHFEERHRDQLQALRGMRFPQGYEPGPYNQITVAKGAYTEFQVSVPEGSTRSRVYADLKKQGIIAPESFTKEPYLHNELTFTTYNGSDMKLLFVPYYDGVDARSDAPVERLMMTLY